MLHAFQLTKLPDFVTSKRKNRKALRRRQSQGRSLYSTFDFEKEKRLDSLMDQNYQLRDRTQDRSRNGFEKREKRRRIRKLQDAISDNDMDKVRECLQESFDVDFQYRGQTALQHAVKEGKFEICKLLIGRGAEVDVTDAEKNSLLNMACWRGHYDIAELLIRNNANINSQNDGNLTPLNACAIKGECRIAQLLLQANCTAALPDSSGNTPLHTAVKHNQEAMVQILAKNNDLLDCINEENRTPLMLASSLGHSVIVDILLENGADTKKQDRRGRSAVLDAAENGHDRIIKSLLQYNADVNLSTKKGHTPLLEAINNSHLRCAELLIEYPGCDPDKTDRSQHQAPIHAAVRQVSQTFGNDSDLAMDVVKNLVSHGCNINIQDNQGWTPLYQSAFAGNAELTGLLLDKGADLSVKTKEGDTVLHGAVYGYNVTVVELLIKAGCAVNEINNKGMHALYSAVMSRGDVQIVKSLINAGSDLNLQESASSLTPLHEAIVQYFTQAAVLLIKSGCDINRVNGKKQTPLYTACEKGNDALVENLLATPGCKVGGAAQTTIPLHAAVMNNFSYIVQKLINAGANINELNFDGLTPIMVASQENSVRAAKVLLRNGCDLQAHAKVKKLMKCCLFHEDAHPHFDLEPMFLAMAHKNLELLQLYVYCSKHPSYKTIKTLSEILRTARELHTHLSKDQRQNILKFFKDTIEIPRSLQEICRGNIRDLIGCNIYQKMEELPVANKLKEYLLMKEILGEMDAEEEEEERHVGRFTFVGRLHLPGED